MNRIIFHLDMDAFFASVELAKNPYLAGKAVIVGGNPNSRGVVSTCSYEARVFGVKSAMSLFHAKKLCPHAIFIDGDFAAYRAYSNKIFELLRSYTSFIEQVSIDEAYIDVTNIADQYGGFKNLAELFKKKIHEETTLKCSIGIAKNKLVAKIASSLAKPNGIYDVPDGYEEAILGPLPIQAIPGIGAKTKERLNAKGFFIIKDLRDLSLEYCLQHFGSSGYHFYKEARGEDSRPVLFEERNPKSLGAETTFEKDKSDETELLRDLYELTNRVVLRLRQHKMRTRSISIKLRSQDFKTVTRSKILYGETQDLTSIYLQAESLFKEHFVPFLPLRLVGISLEKLNNSWWQPTFWNYTNYQK